MLDMDDIHEKLTTIYAEGSVEGYSSQHLGSKMCFLCVPLKNPEAFKPRNLVMISLRHKLDMKDLFKKGKKGWHICTKG